ncbi:MAG: head-tail adaptor protein [Allosphingosinicella sp.]
MTIESRKLTHRVRFERRSAGRSSVGNRQRESWDLHCDRWAQPIVGRGEDRRRQAQEDPAVAATFRLRRDSKTGAMNPEDYRLRGDLVVRSPDLATARVWDIRSVTPYGTDGLEVTAICQAAPGATGG